MIEPLPIAFKARERIYRQLARKGIVALYEVRNFRHVLIGFELIIVRYQRAHARFSWNYPERERYPIAKEFGRYAWSFPNQTREMAELALDLLATMPFNRSKPCCADDFKLPKGHDSGPAKMRRFLTSVATGRQLPKSPHRHDRMKDPTEQMEPKSS